MGYTTLMNYLIPKNLGRVPEWDQLVKISNVSNISIDWLLTGKGTANQGCSAERCSEEVQRACTTLREIMISDVPVVKDALISNLAAFQHSIKQEQRIKYLEEMIKPGTFTGTGEAASSSTGRKKT